MSLRLGDGAPDFTADTTQGKVKFHDWIGSGWAILFSHPRDFTPVCTTELGYVARLKPEFDKRNVKAIGLSIDPVNSHEGWAKDIQETQGHAPNFPIIADPDKKVANLYGMIHPAHDEVYTVQTVFLIDPQKKVRLMITDPQTTGRNFDEILRVIDSLQLTAHHKVATPVNWKQGEDVIIVPAVADAEAKTLFPHGWKTIRPYLRVVAQPDKHTQPAPRSTFRGTPASAPVPRSGLASIAAAAQAMMARVLVEEQRGTAVRINVLILGSIHTEVVSNAAPEWLTPDDVGVFCAYLASKEGRMVSGGLHHLI